jgi:hypothetical protein
VYSGSTLGCVGIGGFPAESNSCDVAVSAPSRQLLAANGSPVRAATLNIPVPQIAIPPQPSPLRGQPESIPAKSSWLGDRIRSYRDAFQLRRVHRRNRREYERYSGMFIDHPGMQQELDTVWHRVND